MYTANVEAQQNVRMTGQARELVRWGLQAARIGADFLHKFGISHMNIHGQTMIKGSSSYLGVQDLSRDREAQTNPNLKWVCKHYTCAGKHWASKSELLADHPEQKEMINELQRHVYLGVLEVEAQAAHPERRDDKGKTIPAVEAKLSVVKLFSDEQ